MVAGKCVLCRYINNLESTWDFAEKKRKEKRDATLGVMWCGGGYSRHLYDTYLCYIFGKEEATASAKLYSGSKNRQFHWRTRLRKHGREDEKPCLEISRG